MRFRITTIFFTTLLLLSCNSGTNCYESNETLMVTTFIGNQSTKIGPLVITGYGKNAVGDTLFNLKDSALLKRVTLPLSLTSDSTGFIAFFNNKSTIFWVRHSMDIKFISQSCGFAPYYLINATKYLGLIDSLRVSQPIVDPKSTETFSTNGQNITIYLHLTAY